MATPQEKLAQSLEVLKGFQNKQGIAIIKAEAISRVHKDRLLKNGFIKEVIKGWYISSNPEERKGDTTTWYTVYWQFCEVYLNDRFAKEWCTSPEQSISIHSGNWTIPEQFIIRSKKASNKKTDLIYNTSLYAVNLSMPEETNIIKKNGIQLFSLPTALITCTPSYFAQKPMDARTALSTVRDSSDILATLLEGGNSTVAGRLAGAFRNIGNERIADDIIKTMKSAGYDVRENDPFENKLQFSFTNRTVSPYVNRIKVMWQQMREPVLKHFPQPPGIPKDKAGYMKLVEENYKSDAYHSLSIEGYKVTTELIVRVRGGNWNPETNEKDKQTKDALAARGYYLAFEAVIKSIEKVFSGENPGKVTDDDHGDWYREMFSPIVTSGLIQRADLAGYRNSQVFISNSNHIPMIPEGVRDAMPTLFELLKNENDPSVRSVLGHFVFVYIHPYMDGNGRLARFLMNVMLASGGYPWTIIPVERRKEYMSALENASVKQNIEDFVKFIAKLVSEGMK
ncbi:MAG: Fic family protein [Ignavibacteriaceae bacterium]